METVLVSAPPSSTPEQLANLIATDLARWRAVAKAGSIQSVDY